MPQTHTKAKLTLSLDILAALIKIDNDLDVQWCYASELAECFTGFSALAIKNHLGYLIELGYVESMRDTQGDRRIKMYRITDAGRLYLIETIERLRDTVMDDEYST